MRVLRALILGVLVGTLVFLGDYYWPTSPPTVELETCNQECIDDLNDFIFREDDIPQPKRTETPVVLQHIGG